jgi:hypothetical protein
VRGGLGPKKVLNLLRCALAAEDLIAVRVAMVIHTRDGRYVTAGGAIAQPCFGAAVNQW